MLGVEESTLRKRLQKGFGVSSLGSFKPTFDEREEEELADYCRNLDLRFYGMTIKTLRELAYQYAMKNNIKHRFSDETKMAGVDWARSFMSRHNLVLRTPQKTSVGRIMGFNKPQVSIFFDNLTELMTKFQFPPSRVFNMDESGIPTVPNKVPKVISPKGKKLVGKVVSADRGQSVTVVCCMSAAGNYIPPAIIFPRKRDRPELMHGAPPGSVMFLSDSGYINSNLFVDWLKHFQHHCQPTNSNPVLLILDNHSSHISLEAVTYAKEHFIHLLSIPPHSSHKLQPLDKCFFKPLKDYYATNCDQWMVNNPGKVLGQFQVAELFGQAYMRCATVEKGVSGFRTCGIIPVNRFVFSDADFLPADVTDQPMQTGKDHQSMSSDNEEENDFPEEGSEHPQPSTSTVNRPTLSYSEPRPSTSAVDTPPEPRPSTSSADTSRDIDTSSNETALLQLPKISSFRKRMRKGKKSTILTSTPNKKQLEEERNKKLVNDQKKSVTRNLNIGSKKKCNARDKPSTPEDEVRCPGCEEMYEDPPTEDWVQCSKCRQWWHENCSSYEGGKFVCDLC